MDGRQTKESVQTLFFPEKRFDTCLKFAIAAALDGNKPPLVTRVLNLERSEEKVSLANIGV